MSKKAKKLMSKLLEEAFKCERENCFESFETEEKLYDHRIIQHSMYGGGGVGRGSYYTSTIGISTSYPTFSNNGT